MFDLWLLLASPLVLAGLMIGIQELVERKKRQKRSSG